MSDLKNTVRRARIRGKIPPGCIASASEALDALNRYTQYKRQSETLTLKAEQAGSMTWTADFHWMKANAYEELADAWHGILYRYLALKADEEKCPL